MQLQCWEKQDQGEARVMHSFGHFPFGDESSTIDVLDKRIKKEKRAFYLQVCNVAVDVHG